MDLTLHNSVNLCLSCGGLPCVPGKFPVQVHPIKVIYLLSSVIDDWINVSLLAAVDAIVLNLNI